MVVLGVDRGVQLVNSRHWAAALGAFFSEVALDAICVERSPRRFARGGHYELTYEIQDVLIPWERENGIPLLRTRLDQRQGRIDTDAALADSSSSDCNWTATGPTT